MTDPHPAPSTSPRSGPEMTMTTEPQQQPLTDRIDAALKATEGHTAGQWYYQHGHGIEVWRDGTCGLLIWPEQGAKATGIDLDLMAAAPDLRALLTECMAELRAQAEALARAERDLAQERSSHSDTVDQRDRAHDAADRLAYVLFDIDEIGEHTSCNCPWANAAARLEEMAVTAAEVSQ